MFKIIDTHKNLKWKKDHRKAYCCNSFGVIDEFLTKLINPKNLNNEEWFKVNNICSDIFDIEYDGETYKNYTLSNGRVIQVL